MRGDAAGWADPNTEVHPNKSAGVSLRSGQSQIKAHLHETDAKHLEKNETIANNINDLGTVIPITNHHQNPPPKDDLATAGNRSPSTRRLVEDGRPPETPKKQRHIVLQNQHLGTPKTTRKTLQKTPAPEGLRRGAHPDADPAQSANHRPEVSTIIVVKHIQTTPSGPALTKIISSKINDL